MINLLYYGGLKITYMKRTDLDYYIDKTVQVTFSDMESVVGKLHKSNSDYVKDNVELKYYASHYDKGQKYVLVTRDRNYMFSATNVRKVVEVY